MFRHTPLYLFQVLQQYFLIGTSYGVPDLSAGRRGNMGLKEGGERQRAERSDRKIGVNSSLPKEVHNN
ncbi:hypothetical protein [Robertmurraya sp.]|uniref:hypothetical protein n=1 Tax=Robertmurraya sp. TaxID=2837525 RepID=UPI003704111C